MDLDLTGKKRKNLAKQPSDLERIMFNMVWFAMALTKHGGWTCCQDWFMRSNSVCPSIGNAKLPVFLSMCLVCAVSTYPHTHMAPWCANTERHYETPCDLNKNLGSAIHVDDLMGFPDESHLTTHPMHLRHRPKWHGKTPAALLPLAKDSSSGQGIRSWPDPPQGAAWRRRLAGTSWFRWISHHGWLPRKIDTFQDQLINWSTQAILETTCDRWNCLSHNVGN